MNNRAINELILNDPILNELKLMQDNIAKNGCTFILDDNNELVFNYTKSSFKTYKQIEKAIEYRTNTLINNTNNNIEGGNIDKRSIN